MKKVGYIIAIIVNVILYYIFNNLLNWHIGFITGDFKLVLPVLNISILAAIVGNVILFFYDAPRFKTTIRIIWNIISIVFVYALYKIFPFNFSALPSYQLLNMVSKIILLAVIAGLFIASIVELPRLIAGRGD